MLNQHLAVKIKYFWGSEFMYSPATSNGFIQDHLIQLHHSAVFWGLNTMSMSKNRIMPKQIQDVVDLGRTGKALQRATDTSSPTSGTGNWMKLFYNFIYHVWITLPVSASNWHTNATFVHPWVFLLFPNLLPYETY